MSAHKQILWHTLLQVVLASVILTLLLSCSVLTHAQAHAHELPPFDPARLVFETITGNYGNIYNVIQDKDGFLWLAGINGTMKYNGYEAEAVYSGEPVSALFQDSQELIWMVVGSGVAVYDKRTGGITKYFPNSNDPNALSGYSRVAYQKTQLLTEDKDGFIWVATMNGLDKFDKKSRSFTAYKSKAGDATTLLDSDVWSVLTAKDGSLWVGTATGLHKFDPRSGRVLERYAASADDPNALHGKYVQATVEDDQGVIWVGTTEGGLNRLDPKGKTFSHYRADAAEPHKIANNFIYRLANFDSTPDLIWITTVDGLSVLNKRDNTVTNYVYNAEQADKGGLGAKIVHTIIQDRSGIFWLVVNEHGFLQKIDPDSHQFQSILRSQNPKEGFVDVTAPLRLGPDGNIWVNEVTTGIARVDPKTGRIINHFLHNPQKPEGFPAHLEDFDFEPRQKNIVWVVAKGVIVEYNWNTQTVVNRYPSGTQSKIWPVWTDKQNPDLLYGNVWGEGLLRFNKQTGQVTIFAHDPAHPEETLTGNTAFPLLPAYYQIDGNQIWLNHAGIGFDLFDLNTGKVVRKHFFDQTDFTGKEFDAHAGYIDSKGRFWIGQNQYDQAKGKFTSFKNLYGYGFPSTSVCLLAEDRQGLLWAAGFLDGTLTRINPQTGETRVFTEKDGISPGLGSAHAPVTLPDGQIWMAGTGGIIFFYPDHIVDSPYQGPVHITQLMQGGKSMQLGMAPERVEEITLNWNKNFFEFEMAALSYRHPEENQYQYMLEGVDKDWYKAGSKRSGRYSGLSAGTYTLRVRSANNDGVWSDQEATLAITITPPWWSRWWFRSAAVAAMLALAFISYRQRVRSIEQHSRELERQVNGRTRELQLAKNSAEIANRAKSDFLAQMSHELRTPLNAVLGFSQLMQNDRNATTAQKEYLNIINRNGEHLLNLINNVLAMSKIESGRVEPEEASLDLFQLLQEMISLMAMRAQEKGLDFKLEQSRDLPRHIRVDGGKLRQVLINLIGNAIKYTTSGSIILRAMVVEVENQSSGQVRVRFEVEDTGPGIPEEERERIFFPFVQLGDRTPTEAGTGLGLTISKQYVELMGGMIHVAGEPGKGSMFHVEIPVATLSSEAIPVESRHGRVIGVAEGQPRYRLLIVEDHPHNRLLLYKLLEPLGFDLREAANGQEAVAMSAQWHPHLIWMDIRMPVMDGLEATRRIKATDAHAQTRIVAVTAHALEEERGEILAAGCDDFIRKPYRDLEIFDALTKQLGIRFRYADESLLPIEKKTWDLNADQLHKLPWEIMDELSKALELLDGRLILEVIRRIGDMDRDLGERLRRMAENLQYKELLKSLDDLAKKRAL